MPETSLLPSIAPAPAMPTTPSGAGLQPAGTPPETGSAPSFLHQLRTALRGVNASHARAKHAPEHKSDAQSTEDTAKVQPEDDNTPPSNAEAGDITARSADLHLAVGLTDLGVPVPTQALMPAMAPLPHGGASASTPTPAGAAHAHSLAPSGTQIDPAATIASQSVAPAVVSADTGASSTTAALLSATPAQPSTTSDAPHGAPPPSDAAHSTAALTSDGPTPATVGRDWAPASPDGTPPLPAPMPPTTRDGAPLPLPEPTLPAGAPAGPGAPWSGASTGAQGTSRTTIPGVERGGNAAGPAHPVSEPTGPQMVSVSPLAISDSPGSADQRSESDSGLTATPSDDRSAASTSAPTANATFAGHLTHAQSAAPLAGTADQATRATDVATQIAHQADLYRLPGAKGVRIQLHPDDLGGLDVTLRYSAAGGVQLHINVEHAATGQLVQAGWTDLRDALAAQGITPDRLVMSVTAPNGSSGLDLSFNGHDGGRAGAELAGFSQGQTGQRQSPARDDGAGATRTWFSDVDPAASISDDGSRGNVAAASHIDYRV